MNSAEYRRRTRIGLLVLFALVALTELASAVQPVDPPYGVLPTHRRRECRTGPDTPTM